MTKKGCGKRRSSSQTSSSSGDDYGLVRNSDENDFQPQMLSNWKKYEPESLSSVPEEPVSTRESHDFADLLNSSFDCNYFRFKSEKIWEREAANNIGAQKLFNLNIELLASALACIPFYERVGIDKNFLSKCDIEKCDEKALNKLDHYKSVSEGFMKELKLNYELPNLDKDLVKLECSIDEHFKIEPFSLASATVSDVYEPETTKHGLTETDIRTTEIDEKKENLEDWLDSVLHD